MNKQNITFRELTLKEIDNYDYVSFDVFDTLLVRKCGDPKNIFYLMQRELSRNNSKFNNFAKERVKSEVLARRISKDDEISIEDIYHELKKVYSDANVDNIKSLELEIEKKKIIIISDMYLPDTFIQELLSNNGFKSITKIYVSSKEKLTKHSGALFSRVLDDLDIKCGQLLHIGDNERSDYLVPKSMGIEAIKIENTYSEELVDICKSCPVKVKKYSKELEILNSFALNSIKYKEEGKKLSQFYKIGYLTEGPLLYGFSKWLNSGFEKYKIKKAFFLSRDGMIMKKAFDCFNKQSSIQDIYMYASRRAVIVPTLWMYQDIHEMISSVFFPRYGTLSAFFSKMGLNPYIYSSKCLLYGLEMNCTYSYNELFFSSEFEHFIKNEEIEREIIENSQKEYSIFVEYLKNVGFSGNVAIVDIGWHANMQKAIEKICDKENIPCSIYGFYIGVSPESIIPETTKCFGYLFDRGKNNQLFQLEKNFNALLEMFFTADHGTVVKYRKDDRSIIPILKEFEYESKPEYQQDYTIIRDFQNGAIDFIKDILLEECMSFGYSPYIMASNMMSLGNNPSMAIVECLGKMSMLDDSFSRLVSASSLSHYILNPRVFIADMKKSPWRTGFLKAVFKINIPYYRLYNSVRSISNIVRWHHLLE